jgi:nicotinic acid phosphoribosyltransferase
MDSSFAASAAPISGKNPILMEFQNAMYDPRIGTEYPSHREAFNALVFPLMHLIAMIIGCFAFDPITLGVVGVAGSIITATTYTDFYKLSMAPTIHAIQATSGGPAIATFALDVRDKNIRDQLAANIGGITDAVIQALNALQNRTFDYQVILDTVRGKPFEGFFHSPEGRAIFMNPDGSPRTLISATVPAGAPVYPGTVIYTQPIEPSMLVPGQVSIAVFMASDAKTGENRLHIEATGEWSKVSFLETTMMQVVYQIALYIHLQKRGCSFGQWLYEALFRFYLSVTFSGTHCPEMTGFLFAGRRTGHFLLLLLQALLAKKIPGSKIVGTSSFDAWAFLTTKLGLTDIAIPVGTHAHEIQMGAQALYAHLDTCLSNGERLPLSACVSTYLYYVTAHKGSAGPMPMLPDTLGTESFCKAAAAFWVHPFGMTTWVTLLSLINSARQDSGDLGAFAATMRKYDFKGTLFASEIDTADTLHQAASLGYKAFGAGGFMGDSEKVWKVTDDEPLSSSMAGKIVRMWQWNKRTETWVRCRNPVKLGDGEDLGKVTADPLLSAAEYQQVIADAQVVKQSAKDKPFSSSQFFFCPLPQASEHGLDFRICYGRFDPSTQDKPRMVGILYDTTNL